MYYVYYLISPIDNKIFYVGKGKGSRMREHVSMTKRDKVSNNNTYLFRKIKKILEQYNDVIYDVVFRTDSEKEAYDKEQEIINDIGVSNLCNISLGYNILNVETKEKISKTMKYKYEFDDEFILKMQYVFENRKSDEYRKDMSISLKNSKKHKSIYTEDFKKKISDKRKKWWESLSDDEMIQYKKNMSEVLKNSKKHKESLQKEEYKLNLSNGIKNSELFKKYNEDRKGKPRGKYKESINNIKRRIKSKLVDDTGNIIKEFVGLNEICDFFNIKNSTASIWLKNGKFIDGLFLVRED